MTSNNSKMFLFEYYKHQDDDYQRMYGDPARAHKQRQRLVVMREVLSEIHLPGYPSVLDMGSGDCYAANQILGPTAIGRYVAIDLSSSKLERGRERIDKSSVAVGDIENLPLCDRSVDLVICSEVLEHLLSPDAAIAEMNRVLRPGGFCLISAPVDSWFQVPLLRAWSHVSKLLGRQKFNEHVQVFTVRRLERLLSAHGFGIIKAKRSCFNVPFFEFGLRQMSRARYSVVDSLLCLLPIHNLGSSSIAGLAIGAEYLIVSAQKLT